MRCSIRVNHVNVRRVVRTQPSRGQNVQAVEGVRNVIGEEGTGRVHGRDPVKVLGLGVRVHDQLLPQEATGVGAQTVGRAVNVEIPLDNSVQGPDDKVHVFSNVSADRERESKEHTGLW